MDLLDVRADRGVHDANPYEDPPSAFPTTPRFPWSGESWRDSTPSTPRVHARLGAGRAGRGRVARRSGVDLQGARGARSCATVLLAARFAARPALAAAFVGWNPLLAIHLAGGGHNDAWVGALAPRGSGDAGAGRRLGARRGREVGSVRAVSPARARRATAGRAGSRSRLTTGAVAALATWRYGFAWLDAFGPLADNARETTSYALPHRLSQLGVPEGAAIALFAALFALVYVALAREAWRGRARLGLASVALLACAPYVTPWYLAWVVPLAAVEEDKLARVLALAFTAYLLPQTIPV